MGIPLITRALTGLDQSRAEFRNAFVFGVSTSVAFPPGAIWLYTFSPNDVPLGNFINTLPADTLYRGELTQYSCEYKGAFRQDSGIATGMVGVRWLYPLPNGLKVALSYAPFPDQSPFLQRLTARGGNAGSLIRARFGPPREFVAGEIPLAINPADFASAAFLTGYIKWLANPPAWLVDQVRFVAMPVMP